MFEPKPFQEPTGNRFKIIIGFIHWMLLALRQDTLSLVGGGCSKYKIKRFCEFL